MYCLKSDSFCDQWSADSPSKSNNCNKLKFCQTCILLSKTKTSLTDLCMWVFWAQLVVGSDDGGGGRADLHLGLGGGVSQVLQVAQAKEEYKGVEGQENEHSAATDEAWHQWDQHWIYFSSLCSFYSVEARSRGVTSVITNSTSRITLWYEDQEM